MTGEHRDSIHFITTRSNRPSSSKLMLCLKDSRGSIGTFNSLANSSHLAEWHLITSKTSEQSGDFLRRRLSSVNYKYTFGENDI